MSARRTAAALAAAGALLLSGCDFSVYDLPLPGGADLGRDPIEVTVRFRDVLDLVPQSAVKVDDISVGRVEDVTLDGWTAEVTLLLRRDVALPDNAEATIRQTSLLGEKFVSLAPPEGGPPRGTLDDGDLIDLPASGRNPEVEEVLGALSLVLNGGGVGQLKTITSEVNRALDGREGGVRSVLTQVDGLMTQLDTGKEQILTALERVDALSVSLNRRTDDLDLALDELPSALRSVDGQRRDLVRMLRALDRLSSVGTRVIRATKQGTIDSLDALAPTLTELARAGDSLPDSLQILLTYPFVDSLVGKDPTVARDLHMGDYTNLSAVLDLDLSNGLPPLGLPGVDTPLPGVSLPPVLPSLPVPTPTLALPDLPELPGLPGLPELPGLGGLTGGESNGGSGGRGSGGSGGGGGLGGVLPGLLGRPSRRNPDGRRAGRDAAVGGESPVITRRAKVQLMVFVLITLVGVSFVGGKYAQLDRLVVDDTYRVTAHLADSGGVFTGAEVSYRGVTVGRVGEMRLTDDGVDVSLDIDKEQSMIPADTGALVGNRSAVGEQYVELQPASAGRPYLREGSEIERSRTTLPTSSTDLLTDTQRLVASVPRGDLRTVVAELGAAFQGSGDDLGRLIDSSSSFLTTADANLDLTRRLIADSNVVLGSQLDKASAIRSFARDLSLVSDTLVAGDADLRRIIANGSATATQVRGFLEDNEVDLARLLNNLVTTGDIAVRHLADTEMLLVVYPFVVAGGFTVVDRTPETGMYDAHFGLVLTQDPTPCHQGYEATGRRPAQQTDDQPLDTRAGCAERPEVSNARGAQNARRVAPATPAQAAAAPVVGTYDRRSGELTYTDPASGPTVSYTGGADAAFGKESWKWLLLQPLNGAR